MIGSKVIFKLYDGELIEGTIIDKIEDSSDGGAFPVTFYLAIDSKGELHQFLPKEISRLLV